jgi:hypothetical protein
MAHRNRWFPWVYLAIKWWFSMAMLNNQRVYSCFLAYASSYPRCFMVMVWPAGLLASPCVSLKFPLCLVQSSLCCLNSVCSIHFPRLLLKFIVSLFNPNHYMLIPRIHSLGSFPFPFPGVCSAGLPSDYLIFKIAWFLMIYHDLPISHATLWICITRLNYQEGIIPTIDF